jgi:hypothetical protein
MGELEELSIVESDKILPHSVLLACKQLELIEWILPGLFDS